LVITPEFVFLMFPQRGLCWVVMCLVCALRVSPSVGLSSAADFVVHEPVCPAQSERTAESRSGSASRGDAMADCPVVVPSSQPGPTDAVAQKGASQPDSDVRGWKARGLAPASRSALGRWTPPWLLHAAKPHATFERLASRILFCRWLI
jgi:hypothetical protein